jgi:protein-L-isoaspartate(D-aspartate) O-methyltransferase
MDKNMVDEQDDFAAQRERMVREQIEARGFYDQAVLKALRSVPREAFVLPAYRHFAYDDTPLPIPGQQTISQPYVVALMLRALRLKPENRVLEVGAGSGYAAALLSRIVREVYTVERLEVLVNYARQRLAELGYNNVTVRQGDGSRGWPEHAPYDGIVVAAGGPSVPASLKAQLAIGGRLVIPVGVSTRSQDLLLLLRHGEHEYEERNLGPVAFVPLIGDEGWEADGG